MHDYSRSDLYESLATSKISHLSITCSYFIYRILYCNLQKLRARLVPYLKFEFIHADRVIIREQNDPLTVYFVVSGEIEVKKFVYERVSSMRFKWQLCLLLISYLFIC